MKIILFLFSTLLSFSLMAQTQIVPRGLSGSMIDMDLPNNSENVVPSNTTGVIYRARCFGRNNRGVQNPVSPDGTVTAEVSYGEKVTKISHKGNFAQKSAMVARYLPMVEAIKGVYGMSCNNFCDENPTLCNRNCNSFQECFNNSVSFDFPTIVLKSDFAAFIDEDGNEDSFLHGRSAQLKQDWNMKYKQELSDLYDHILRENGSKGSRCNTNAETYVLKFDSLAQQVCQKAGNQENKTGCRERALCAFSCGIGGADKLEPSYTKATAVHGGRDHYYANAQNADLVAIMSAHPAVDFDKGEYANSNVNVGTAINHQYRDMLISLFNESGDTYTEQCVQTCRRKLANATRGGYYRSGLDFPTKDETSNCKIDGNDADFCQDGLIMGYTNKLGNDVEAAGLNVVFKQSGTPYDSYKQFTGYNGVMSSNKVSYFVSKAPGAGDDAIPAVIVDAQMPGQDGYCGGYHSPLMVFFDYKHPQYSNKSDFLKRFDEGTETYWPEANHYGFFLAQVDVKNPDKGIWTKGQLFGDNYKSYTGFDFLKEHDSNHDGKINSKDDIWSRLVLWKDKNGDGHGTKDELVKLSDKGIFEISLEVDESYGYQVADRAQHVGKSVFKYKKGNKVAIGDVTDVYFADAN